MNLPSTSKRVAIHSRQWDIEKMERSLLMRLRYYAQCPEEIDERLLQLDREWDIERTLETNAASLALIGIGLGFTVSRKWFVLPAIVIGFLLQHALQGWCPPLPVLRRLGIRTQSEIEMERYILKAMRGDFGELGIMKGAHQSDPAVALHLLEDAKK